MTKSATLQTILNTHLPAYMNQHRLSPPQSKACHRLCQCRTEALGGEHYDCDQCHQPQVRYHSCRNRHCPQCQGRASAQWCERRCEDLLPVHYHHLVFTLPHTLNGWAQLHPEQIYQALFQSAWTTLKAFGQDPKRLDGEVGMTAVLHTWGQTLGQHIHLHCLIPSGAWNRHTQQWHPAHSHYLFPVRALSRKFRGAMVSALRQYRNTGQLPRITRDFDATLDTLMQTAWVVYSKPHLQRPETVVNYLARYTHKIAIDNRRIINASEATITFRYKDYRDHDRHKHMQLSSEEFIRRYLLHILPDGFMRIRHYGFLANACRRKKLAQIRRALDQVQTADNDTNVDAASDTKATLQGRVMVRQDHPDQRCPHCKTGRLRWVSALTPKRRQRTP